MRRRSSGRLFFSLFLPAAVGANLALGLIILDELRPNTWLGGLEVATGAFCCTVAGWLAAAAWSRSYWSGAMTRQIAAWRRVVDAFFEWMEETPPPAEALMRLKGSLDSVLQHEHS